MVHHSNLSETVWYPPDLSEPSNFSDHPDLRESRSEHPELSASPIFEGGHLPDKWTVMQKVFPCHQYQATENNYLDMVKNTRHEEQDIGKANAKLTLLQQHLNILTV